MNETSPAGFSNAEFLAVIGTHLKTALFFGLMPTLVIALIITGVIAVFAQRTALVVTGLVVALFGASIGLLLGASREAAVGTIVPGIVTLAGALLAIIFPQTTAGQNMLKGVFAEQDEERFRRGLILTSIAALSLSTITGANFGASVRGQTEAFQQQQALQRLYYEEVEIPAQRALLERDQILFEEIEVPIERAQLERALGLAPPPEAPEATEADATD